MKQLFFLAALLPGVLCLYAQDSSKTQFTVNIIDSTQVMSVTQVGAFVYPVISDPDINELFSSYQLSKFERAYPASRLRVLRDVWLVEVDTGSISLMYELAAMHSQIFMEPVIVKPSIPLYTPNDYGAPTQQNIGSQKGLDLVKAKAAWDITHGNPNVIIGVSDTYFETTHNDLQGKIVNVRANSPFPNWHGLAVAGVAAAATDNNIGLASIGFNCRLDVSSTMSDNELLDMSRSGIRIINASWFNSCSPQLDRQVLYSEIYENGAIACFGAGNGWEHCRFGPVYPAAFDHNISVTSIGADVDYGVMSNFGNGPIAWNWKDVHWCIVGKMKTVEDPVGSGNYISVKDEIHNHNGTVDISAPGYNIPTLDLNNGYTHSWGTSFASPLVAGTFGLMRSVKPCITPYQLEYGLKYTAKNIYNIQENFEFTGMLGAGRLDAAAAVSWAAGLDCNSSLATTMYIKGIEINSICQPGQSTNGITPRLYAIIENGTAPFTYKWDPVPGNNSTLDDPNTDHPRIVASINNHRAYYRVTVYDNSYPQKVASKVIDIFLTDAQTYDLAMRDSYVDMLREPNDQLALDPRDWDIWRSPDVWNRKNQDGIMIHENPEYFTSNPNYAYARVRNVGCKESPAGKQLRLYWTKASTGEDWPDDWTTANIVGTGGLTVPAGREITSGSPISIPSLQPGEEWITSTPWNPVAPGDYDPTINTVDVCFLARIEEDPIPPYGMHFSETAEVSKNARENNNIVTRNFIVTNFLPGNAQRHQILVGNIHPFSSYFDLQFIPDRAINPHMSGDIGAAGEVTLYMGDLFDRWVHAGMRGTYRHVDRENRTVTFDGSTILMENIQLEANERVPIIIEFNGLATSEISHEVHFRQFYQDTLCGNVTFQIEASAVSRLSQPTKPFIQDQQIGNYLVFPNPTTENVYLKYIGTARNNRVTIQVIDANGRFVKTISSKTLNTSETRKIEMGGLSSGIYYLMINDSAGRSVKLRFLKL